MMAQPSPDSDLVKLTKEFESLKKELAENAQFNKDHCDSIAAAQTNCQMSVSYNQKKIENLQRQRNVLVARIENCHELLKQLTERYPTNSVLGACDIGLGRVTEACYR